MADITTTDAERGGQTGGTTGASAIGIAATDSDTASVTEDNELPVTIEWTTAPEAAATNIIAQMAGDVDESVFANITQGSRSACGRGGRNVEVDFSALWDGGDIEVTGLKCDGTFGTETITSTPGSVVQGSEGFLFITRVRNLGTHGAGTADVELGLYLAVPVGSLTPTLARIIETTAGTDMTPAGAISALGLVDISDDAADGVNKYLVAYTLANTYTDAGHTHGLTDPTHTHTM